MTSIWGISLAPGESIMVPAEGAIQLSHATLSLDPNPGRTVLQVIVDDVAYALCVLQKDITEVQKLAHCFLPNDRALLTVTGTNSIQIVGNLMKLQEPDFDTEEEQDEEHLEYLASMRPKCGTTNKEEEKPKPKVSFELLNDISKDEDDNDYMQVSSEEDSDDSDYKEDDKERETISGEPRYASYISDLLGPDLPDEEDKDFEFNQTADDYGTLAFRDPADNDFLGGFELRHFNLVPNYPGFEKVDLREQEKTREDTLLQ